MTKDEKLSDYETLKHRREVARLCNLVAVELIKRGQEHDESKSESPELEGLAAHYSRTKLDKLSYDSPEYQASLKELQPTLEHHYARNRHHPEHFPNGINDMTLIDIVEWFLDCKASSMRQNDGNLRKSISKAAERFKIDPQLRQILENTVAFFNLDDEL
jgi:hypothetical protein